MTLDDIRHFDLRSINLRDIDVSAAGEWPPVGKAVSIILVGILLFLGMFERLSSFGTFVDLGI